MIHAILILAKMLARAKSCHSTPITAHAHRAGPDPTAKKVGNFINVSKLLTQRLSKANELRSYFSKSYL